MRRKACGRYLLYTLQLVLILVWTIALAPLIDTNTYYSVYLLCAGVGIVCAFLNWRNTARGKLSPRKLAILLLFSLLFSAAVLLANYKLYFSLPGIRKLAYAGLLLAGGFSVGFAVLLRGMECSPKNVPADHRYQGAKRVFWCSAAVMSCIYLLYLLFSAYPANMTPDSYKSLIQIQTGEYANDNPFWHTQLIRAFMTIGYVFFDGINGALAVYSALQSLIFAMCLAYVVVTLYQTGLPHWVTAVTLAVYALMPHNIAYSVTLWKDILFSASVLLVVTALYRILWSVGASQRLNHAVFTVGAVGFCLLRTNGWATFLVTSLVVLVALGKKQRKLSAIVCTVLAACWILTNPLLTMWNVTSTDFVETLAVPFQQVARVITHGYTLAPEDYELLNKVFDVTRIPEVFSHEIVDPIKGAAMRSGQKQYLLEHMGEYARLWLRLGVQHPGEYLKAWIELTKGYWNAGYEYWVYYEGGMHEGLGIVRTAGENLMAACFRSWFDGIDSCRIFQPLYSIGLHVWMLFGCFAVNLANRRKEWILAVPGMILIFGLWLGAPVFSEFRYAYPVVLTLPLIAAATIYQPQRMREFSEII